MGTSERGNEPSGSIECGEFLDWLRTDLLLKKDCCMEEVSNWLGNLLHNFIHMFCTNFFKYQVCITDIEDF